MQLFHHSFRLTVPFLLLPSLLAIPASARETTVVGTAHTVYDLRQRTYDQKAIDPTGKAGDSQKIGVGPVILVVSKGSYDTQMLEYSPLLFNEFVTQTVGVDHKLKLNSERQLSRYWSFTVSDDFIRSDDPSLVSTSSLLAPTAPINGQPPIPPANVLSRDLSGRKFWTNTAMARTVYNLEENSRIGGGYMYSVLRNDEGGDGFDEYDKHTVFTDFTYGFNRSWRSSLGLNYTRGLYNHDNSSPVPGSSLGSPDLNEYGVTAGVDYIQSMKDFYPLKYSFTGTQFDGDLRRDHAAHQWSVGWDHSFDPRTRMSLGGGPSYAQTQGLDGSWGYNAYMTFLRRYEHSSYALQFNKQFATQNFTGSTQSSGQFDTYNATAIFNYQYTEFLGFDTYGRYSWQDSLVPNNVVTTGTTALDRNIYEAGVHFNYLFAQWYKAGIKYAYYVSDGNLASDQYTDHQVFLTLAATKELWRW